MTSKYIRRTFSIFIVLLSLSALMQAQKPEQDSVVKKQYLQKNIGYGSQPAWMVTSAVSTVSGEDLMKSFTPNLGNHLYGQLPGLTVMQGGSEPGLQTPTIRIRGLNTFGSGNDPLIVVDGFVSPYEQLVPEEIESVSLLKDASATAIYGSKGANGVLLITTKRGKEGPLKVSFSTQQGISSPTHLPQSLGAYDYATLYNEALVNEGKPELYTSADLDAYKTGSDPVFHPDVNWNDQVLRKNCFSSKYDLNFSGGNSTVHYYVLLDINRNEGLLKKTKDLTNYSSNSVYTKFNYRSNVDILFSKSLTASLTLGGSIADKKNPVNNNLGSLFTLMSTLPPNSFPVFNPNNTISSSLLYANPWGEILNKGNYTSNGRVFEGALAIKEKLDMLTPGLSISGDVSFNSSFTSLSNKSRTYLTQGIKPDATLGIIYSTIGLDGSLSGSEGESDQWRRITLQGTMNYDRTFGSGNLSGIVRFNQSQYNFSGTGLPFLDRALSGRLTYSNSEKYIAEFSFGYSGSKEFPEGKRWGFFPAASLGWVVSNEGFLKNNSFVNYLKIKGSYGMVGNDNIGGTRFMWNQTFVNMTNYILGNPAASTATIGEGLLSNPNVTWEKQKQSNIGLELTLMNHLDVTFDYFNQNRYDILAQPYSTLPAFTGISTPGLNVGKNKNKGFEGSVRYNSDPAKSLQYYLEVNATYAKNEIVYRSEAIQLYDWLYSTGHPVGQPFVYQFAGFFSDATDIANSPKQIFATTVVPGDMKYKDQNGDGLIDQNDKIPLGNTGMPLLTIGLQGGLKYKGFDFSFTVQGVSGRTVYLSGRYFEAFQNSGTVTSIALGRWTSSTAATATYPRLSTTGNLNNYQGSSFWQRNGDFIKIRNIELGYTLPASLMAKVKLGESRIFINGTDLISFDHMDFTDPENLSGYPPMRTYSIGLRIQL